jgi:hypothetical protein
MAFDKVYPNRKDHRKKFYGAKSFDHSCRNHGTCDYCKDNRLYKNNKRKLRAFFEL